MKEKLIEFKTAKLAKEKGFEEKTPFYYYYYEDNKNNRRLYSEKILKAELKENEVSHTRYRMCGGGPDATDYEKSFVKYNDLLIDINRYPARNVMFQAPTQSLLQKWLREKYKKHIDINPFYYKGDFISWNLRIHNTYYKDKYNSYEEALEIGLQEVLKLI